MKLRGLFVGTIIRRCFCVYMLRWKCIFCQASYMSLSLCPSNGDDFAADCRRAVADAPLIQGPAK
ncbi:hypothetical protein H5410_035960 [Solanum commersonii]|uniref:Uncharacterized protein n=1 Tax=Solanum commersonii TaxID=4109 RepID=A0A9J5Y551_SOLCO|nr:hypothetical protein H5410_035960 [Solanum commersonii]